MGLNLETLVGILLILILLILLDGLRRMLRERRSSLRMTLKPRRRPVQDEDDGVIDELNPELPGGGARVVRRATRTLDDDADGHDSMPPERDLSRAQQQALFEEPPAPTPAPAPRPAARAPATRPVRPQVEDPLDVIVIHLLAQQGVRFDGRELLQELLEAGLRYGEMDIFHLYREEQGEDVLQFSMANAFKPGTFDLATMNDQAFAGMTFFMKLPGPGRPVQALERLLDTVSHLAQRLGGELKDEQRNPLTAQAMAHLTERVQEFERRWHLKQE